MNTKELHAYIHGPDFTAVTKWVERVVTDLERKEMIDLTEDIGQILLNFYGKYDFLILEQLVDIEWLELTIRPMAGESIFSEWDDIKLGECLVNDLGGITLVDCGGIYTHPLSDEIVRISSEKMELVQLPVMIGESFDENLTKLIKRR
jgi:hypothetical protein